MRGDSELRDLTIWRGCRFPVGSSGSQRPLTFMFTGCLSVVVFGIVAGASTGAAVAVVGFIGGTGSLSSTTNCSPARTTSNCDFIGLCGGSPVSLTRPVGKMGTTPTADVWVGWRERGSRFLLLDFRRKEAEALEELGGVWAVWPGRLAGTLRFFIFSDSLLFEGRTPSA